METFRYSEDSVRGRRERVQVKKDFQKVFFDQIEASGMNSHDWRTIEAIVHSATMNEPSSGSLLYTFVKNRLDAGDPVNWFHNAIDVLKNGPQVQTSVTAQDREREKVFELLNALDAMVKHNMPDDED